MPDALREQARLGLVVVPLTLGGLFLLAAFWLVAGGSLGPVGKDRAIDSFLVGVLLVCGPYGFWAGREADRLRRLEERFPDLVRDLATNHQAGLPLPAAIAIAADGDYGALTSEVVRMRDQLSWAVPLEEVLERFSQRVRTPLVRRTVALIVQAGRSGGNTADVLLAAARDARELKTVDLARRHGMGTYTAVVYVTFLVFVAVLAILFRLFVPSIIATAGAAIALGENPPLLTRLTSPSLENYRNFYLTAVAVQALGSGIVAGLLQTASPGAGLRHTFWMLAIGYAVFLVV